MTFHRRHFQMNFLEWKCLNSDKISLKFVPEGPINNIPALVQIMAWHRPGDKPLSEPMIVSLPTHICVTRPQWVKLVQDRNPCSSKEDKNKDTLMPLWVHIACHHWTPRLLYMAQNNLNSLRPSDYIMYIWLQFQSFLVQLISYMPKHCLNQWWHCQKEQTYVELQSIFVQYLQLYQQFLWLI